MKPTKCFYEAGETCIIDYMRDDTQTTFYGNENLEQVRLRYPNAEIMDCESAFTAIDQAIDKKYCTGPKRITKEDFNYMLNVLPPVGWHREQGEESFKMSERQIANITGIYIRIGSDYFTMYEDIRMPHVKIMETVNEFIKNEVR